MAGSFTTMLTTPNGLHYTVQMTKLTTKHSSIKSPGEGLGYIPALSLMAVLPSATNLITT